MNGNGSRGANGAAVSPAQRVVSVMLGGTLLTLGLRDGSLRGASGALAGGALLLRGISGRALGVPALGARRAPVREAAVLRRSSITIGAPAETLSVAWRDPAMLARVFADRFEVRPDGERLRWTFRAPGLRKLGWTTRTSEELPGGRIVTRTDAGGALGYAQTAAFRAAPAGRGTEMTLEIEFSMPGGALGNVAAQRLGAVPKVMAAAALRRFKSAIETGEIATLEHNPSARHGGKGDRT